MELQHTRNTRVIQSSCLSASSTIMRRSETLLNTASRHFLIMHICKGTRESQVAKKSEYKKLSSKLASEKVKAGRDGRRRSSVHVKDLSSSGFPRWRWVLCSVQCRIRCREGYQPDNALAAQHHRESLTL